MSFPTSTLVARYEPRLWGYSDGDTINTSTKKFQDDSGNARHLNSAVTGSPTYKTGGVNSLQYVRFSGTSQAVHGSYVGDSDGGTVAMVVVPQATPGSNNSLFSFNNNGSNNGPLIYYDGTHYVGYSNGSGTSSNAITPIIGKPEILWLDSAAASGIVMRANMWPAGSRGSYTAYTPTQFSVAFNGSSAYFQLDIYALFRYSTRLTGTDQTDLETYLYQTYIPTILTGLPSSHLIGLWRADQETYSDGDNLGVLKPITDRSGAGNDLTITLGGGPPAYKTNIYNGKAIYRFGASGDISSTAATFGTSSRQHTVAGILIPRGSIAAGTAHMADHTNALGGYGAGVTTLSGTPDKWQMYEYDGANQLASGGAPAVGTASKLTLLGADNSTCLLRENGSQIASKAVASLQTSTTHYTLGGNSNGAYGQADTPVWMVYDTPIGGQWLTDVETWINNNYVNVAYTDAEPAGTYSYTGNDDTQASGDAEPSGTYTYTGNAAGESDASTLPAGSYTITGYTITDDTVLEQRHDRDGNVISWPGAAPNIAGHFSEPNVHGVNPPAIWLAADRITGYINGGPLEVWPDQSGRSLHLTQDTYAKRPLFRLNSLGQWPAVQFDATDDIMTVSSSRMFTVFQPEALMVAAVAKVSATGVDIIRLRDTPEGGNPYRLLGAGSGASSILQWTIARDTTPTRQIDLRRTTTISAGWHIWAAAYDGYRALAGASFYLDPDPDVYPTMVPLTPTGSHDALVGSGLPAVPLLSIGATGGNSVGGGNWWLAELVVFNQFNLGRLKQTVRYLKSKYRL